ncbi:MAG: antitoxin, RHH family protein [Desulfobacterales bacterium]|nr:antitoxin, RHH family protein [Desulfobacterales bacterium]
MPARNPRINVVLDESLYSMIQKIAKKEGVSMSLTARGLIKEALESHEDMALSQWAEEREKTFDRKKSLTHQQVWSE